MDNPWDTKEFTNFLNEVSALAMKKYGWYVVGYDFRTDETDKTDDSLELLLQPTLGLDSENRKF